MHLPPVLPAIYSLSYMPDGHIVPPNGGFGFWRFFYTPHTIRMKVTVSVACEIDMTEQRREYYRVEYPIIDRPVLSAKAARFEVVDVSEFGVRFKQEPMRLYEPGMDLNARIRFNDGNEFECCGKVLRCDDDTVSVLLHKPLSIQRIRAESVYLLMTYNARYAN
jgi:hypothetical protein